MDMLDLLLRILFIAACVPTGVAVMIMMALTAKPSTLLDHARGIARMLIVSGCLFGIAAACDGSTPKWFSVLIIVGVGFMVCLSAKEIYLKARELEQAKKAAAASH